ncbi:MAG: chromate transporter [Bacteroidaceae bacterium]
MNVYIDSFRTFFKIGLFTVGGGYAMIPLIEEEVVNSKKWITKEDFVDLLAITQSVPGAFALNMSVSIGYRLRGVRGGIVSALGTVLPSFLIILAIALCFSNFTDNPTVIAIFKGIRPAVVALIVAPCIRLGRAAHLSLSNIWLPASTLILIGLLGVSPVYIILAAVMGGFLYGRFISPNDEDEPTKFPNDTP